MSNVLANWKIDERIDKICMQMGRLSSISRIETLNVSLTIENTPHYESNIIRLEFAAQKVARARSAKVFGSMMNLLVDKIGRKFANLEDKLTWNSFNRIHQHIEMHARRSLIGADAYGFRDEHVKLHFPNVVLWIDKSFASQILNTLTVQRPQPCQLNDTVFFVWKSN